MPNVEVSPNFRCQGSHCLGLCRFLVSNDGAVGSSFGLLSVRTLPGASFWVRFSEVGGNFLLRAASNWRYGQGAILIDILCLMDSRSFVGRFPVSSKHWPGPVAHLRVSLSSSSRKFFKMCHEIVHVKIRMLYSIPPTYRPVWCQCFFCINLLIGWERNECGFGIAVDSAYSKFSTRRAIGK